MRSYCLELVEVLAHANRSGEIDSLALADESPASRYFQDLLAGIGAMAADPQNPDALAPVLTTIEEAGLAANPEVAPAEVRSALEDKVGIGRGVSDWITDTGDGLREVKGWTGFGTMVGTATGLLLASQGTTDAVAAAIGVAVPLEVTILAMANRAYRISRRLQ